MARPPRAITLGLDAIAVEGALIASAMLARIAAQPDGEAVRNSYRIPKGLGLRDEITRYFRIGQALFAELNASPAPSAAKTIAFAEAFFRDVLGFSVIARPGTRTLGDRVFPVTLEALGGRVPIIAVPPADELDKPSGHLSGGHRRCSAASALQDWLNANDDAVWGLATNGERLRLMRDNGSLTRPAYIEADLKRIFEGEAFADSSALWLLLHASRFGAAGAPAFDSALERAREDGAREGLAARDRLRAGVEAALLALGSGFLGDERNGALREEVRTGARPLPAFFGQLLRLVYRLIFLLTAEDRDLLHPPGASIQARKLYAAGYALGRLRDRAIRRTAWDRHGDAWEGLLIVFAALARGEKLLGLPALGGLFAPGAIPDLETLRLSNRALMEAIYRLAWLKEPSGLVPVNWRDMQTEELGSVYESLLELTPRLADDGRAIGFAEGGEAKGHARKTTGSYYTPDSLVQALLDSALDPVLDRVEAGADDPAQALLGVTVIDPACGSGHFLLAAARRIAARLARARAGGLASAADYRHALREVARACLHGVDRNPMAVELTKVALWIETVEPGKPLGFLDASIRCGDSLLGVFNLEVLRDGIPDAAYKPLTGDDKATAKHFDRRNKSEKASQGSLDFAHGGGKLPALAPLAGAALALNALPEDSVEEIAEKRRRFEAAKADPKSWAWRVAADLYVAAFLMPKRLPRKLAQNRTPHPEEARRAVSKDEGALDRSSFETQASPAPQDEGGGVPENRNTVTIPTTAHVWQALSGGQVYGPLVGRAQDLAGKASAFHWPLEFPDVMAAGGFDVVLGNPPWERIKLQEQEFFAAREPEIAEAPNAAARGKMIAALKAAEPGTRERALFEEFETAKRIAEASSVFARVSGDDGGRFPLTGRGDVNTYALFAELFANLASPRGRAGVIVPTGIATDATTAPFFAALIEGKRLARLADFENRAGIFPAIDSRIKFCLLTLGREVRQANFAFFLTDAAQLAEPERRFALSAEEIARINPNTKTAPVFRARADAELTAKIYARVPVLINDVGGPKGNPWGVSFARLFDMSNDSGLFRTVAQLRGDGFVRDGSDWVPSPLAGEGAAAQAGAGEGGGAPGAAGSAPPHPAASRPPRPEPVEGPARGDGGRYVPLYEAKMIHQFDHRWATYDGTESRDAALAEKCDPGFEPTPRYFVPEGEAAARLAAKSWTRGWLMGWRDITNATNERTVIAAALPRAGCGDTLLLMFPNIELLGLNACLVGNLCSLIQDYAARQKIGGTHLKYNMFKQLPILPPSTYPESGLAFIVPRVLELTYTSHAMAPFARDLGFAGKPFAWDEDRRANLRAELDAWYARAYGLSRDELRYILDPADIKGPDYPSETFRVLKTNEIRRHGEYRTARLVLAAWDRQDAKI